MRSMTGYGAAVADTAAGRFTVEMRSVNHRFSEVQVRLPRDLVPLEDRVRALVQAGVQRGRVDVAINRDGTTRRPRSVRADVDLAGAYVDAARELARALTIGGELTLSMVAGFPEVIRLEEAREDADMLWPPLAEATRTALVSLVQMREEEGRRLAQDFAARLDRLAELLDQVRRRAADTVPEHAARLRQRLSDLLGEIPVDENRLAGEIALMAERADISEEVTRLTSHIAQFRALAAGEGAVGRKLEFLLQEMGREANTIGAKANDLEITQAVIAIKSELESLREQVANIE